MTTKIKCYTLFDITKTNITSRRAPADTSLDWQNKRNTQCNLDTVIQLVSLRAQPEDITDPIQLTTTTDPIHVFGSSFIEPLTYWTFTFTINHDGVFDDGERKFGLLHSDCENVPMIKVSNFPKNLSSNLDVSAIFGNISFEVITDE